jgi:hypothetical protein
MDPDNPIVKLCLEGARAEFEHRTDDARALCRQAWETAQDDYEACIAAHYVARHQEDPAEALRWNQEALTRAGAVDSERVQPFYPLLYLNMGRSTNCSATRRRRSATMSQVTLPSRRFQRPPRRRAPV